MRSELQNLPEPNWFWHGENILTLIEKYRPMCCVELGTNRGCSAIATATLVRLWGGTVTCVDKWVPGPETVVTIDVFANATVKAGVSANIRMINAMTVEAANHWSGGVDYLYVDANHGYDDVTQDLEAWWPHVRVGGLVTGDDYDDPYDPAHNVTRAWDAFEARHHQSFDRWVTPGLESRLIWGIKR